MHAASIPVQPRDAARARAHMLDHSLAGERVLADALRKQVEAAEGSLTTERGAADALRNRMKELLAGVVRAQKS